jgi:YbbR domain-containing protein
VRPNIDFSTLPENFEFRDVDYEPNTVIINGSPELLDSLGDTIGTVVISLENRRGNFTTEVALDLPNDPSLVILSESSTVAVDIFISEEDSTLPLETVPIRVIGEAENSGLIVTVNPLNISVVLTGPVSIIDSIQAQDVQAIVDVNSLSAGNYSIVPRIEIEQGQVSLETSNITLIPAEVSVTIAEPQPESTQSPELTPTATTQADD